jgi:hypothetical protein
MKDLTLEYFDNYFAMGITPILKKYNASDFETNKTKPNITQLAAP